MFKIILDPNLFECEDNSSEIEQFDHFIFLEKCVEFLANNCDVDLDTYDGAPYCYKTPNYPCPPITKSRYLKIHYDNGDLMTYRIVRASNGELEIRSTSDGITYLYVRN